MLTLHIQRVQEGMVFISMTEDDLLARTARYQIQYSSPKRPRRRSYEDPESDPPNIVSIRHNGDGSVSTSHFGRRWRPHGEDEDEERQAQIPSDFAVLNSSNFIVTTECSDDEEEEDDDYDFAFHTGSRRTHNHPEPFTFDDTDGEDVETPWYLRASERIRPQRPARQESDRRETPSHITIAEAASQIATQEAVKAVGGEYLAAHARFFIEKNKSKCTIKFDPPISGRFILLKMWSPRRETTKNIDIQSVVARGYAGPRLFPAQKFC